MPQAAPAANPNQAPHAPPFGQAAATQPTPNRGYEAAGLQRLGLVVQQLQEILPQVGAGSDVGQVILDSLKKLAKFVPPGSVTPAGQRQQIQNMMQKQAETNQQMQLLRQPPGGQMPAQPQPKVA